MSGLLWNGQPAVLLRGAIAGRWQLSSAEGILTELEEVLRRPKFEPRWERINTTVDRALADLRQHLEIVEIPSPPSIRCSDPMDDMFLACAEAADADYLVTGDLDLLSISHIGRTRIVMVRTFLEELDPVVAQ